MAEAPDEWKALASSNALADLEEAEQDLKTAPDMLAVTRARGWAEIQRWKLERLLRRYFGQDGHAASVMPIQINIGIRREDATNAVQQEVIQAVVSEEPK